MTDHAAILGLLAGAVGIADTIPYVRDTLRGATRPHRGTWLIWGVLAIVVCLSQHADGASWSLVMAAVQAVLTTLIFVLSIRRGEGGLSTTELAMIAIAAGGVGSLGRAAVQPVLPPLIFVLSIRRGEGGLSTTELAMIAIAAGGVVG